MPLPIVAASTICRKDQAYLIWRELPTDAVFMLENSRAATSSQQGGNKTLSDVYSDYLTWALLGLAWSGHVCKWADGLTATVDYRNPILEEVLWRAASKQNKKDGFIYFLSVERGPSMGYALMR